LLGIYDEDSLTLRFNNFGIQWSHDWVFNEEMKKMIQCWGLFGNEIWFLLFPLHFLLAPNMISFYTPTWLNSRTLAGGQSWRTNVFWSLVSFSTFNLHVFLPIIHVFLTTLMVFITYTTILTYKYPSILPYFLTPYHFLPLLTLFLYFSFFFLFQ